LHSNSKSTSTQFLTRLFPLCIGSPEISARQRKTCPGRRTLLLPVSGHRNHLNITDRKSKSTLRNFSALSQAAWSRPKAY